MSTDFPALTHRVLSPRLLESIVCTPPGRAPHTQIMMPSIFTALPLRRGVHASAVKGTKAQDHFLSLALHQASLPSSQKLGHQGAERPRDLPEVTQQRGSPK